MQRATVPAGQEHGRIKRAQQGKRMRRVGAPIIQGGKQPGRL